MNKKQVLLTIAILIAPHTTHTMECWKAIMACWRTNRVTPENGYNTFRNPQEEADQNTADMLCAKLRHPTKRNIVDAIDLIRAEGTPFCTQSRRGQLPIQIAAEKQLLALMRLMVEAGGTVTEQLRQQATTSNNWGVLSILGMTEARNREQERWQAAVAALELQPLTGTSYQIPQPNKNATTEDEETLCTGCLEPLQEKDVVRTFACARHQIHAQCARNGICAGNITCYECRADIALSQEEREVVAARSALDESRTHRNEAFRQEVTHLQRIFKLPYATVVKLAGEGIEIERPASPTPMAFFLDVNQPPNPYMEAELYNDLDDNPEGLWDERLEINSAVALHYNQNGTMIGFTNLQFRPYTPEQG